LKSEVRHTSRGGDIGFSFIRHQVEIVGSIRHLQANHAAWFPGITCDFSEAEYVNVKMQRCYEIRDGNRSGAQMTGHAPGRKIRALMFKKLAFGHELRQLERVAVGIFDAEQQI